MRYVCALLVLSCLLLVLPAQASQADSDCSSDVYCGQALGINAQRFGIWGTFLDTDIMLANNQRFLWNHLLAFGLAQLISTFMLAVQIERLRQCIEANEWERRPNDSSSARKYFRSECSVLRRRGCWQHFLDLICPGKDVCNDMG